MISQHENLSKEFISEKGHKQDACETVFQTDQEGVHRCSKFTLLILLKQM